MDFKGVSIRRRGGVKGLSPVKTGGTSLLVAALFTLLFLSISAPHLYAGEVVEGVTKDGVVVIGTVGEAPPFSWSVKGSEGNEAGSASPNGFDVEIVTAVLEEIALREKIDVTPRFVTVDPIELIPLVAEGEIQMAPGLAHKMGWERAIDFSVTYFNGGTGVVVKRSSSIRRLVHLKGKKIALPSALEISADRVSGAVPGADLIQVEDISSGFELLKEGKVVGVAGDVRGLLGAISLEEKPERFVLVDELITLVPYGIGIPPEDPRWREMIDFSMMKIFESGLYREIYERWFGRDSRTKYPIGFTMEVWPR